MRMAYINALLIVWMIVLAVLANGPSLPAWHGHGKQDSYQETSQLHPELRRSSLADDEYGSFFGLRLKITDFWIAFFTGALVVGTMLQFWALRSQGRLLDRSLEITQNEFEASHRPWVTMHIALDGPLSYDNTGWDAGFRWHVRITAILRHSGETPATNVSLSADVVPFTTPVMKVGPDGKPEGGIIPGTDVGAEIRKLRDAQSSMMEVKMGFGRTLFPHDEEELPYELNGNPALFEAAKNAPGYTGQFMIVACVTYGATHTSRTYATGKAFHLYKVTGDINLSGERLPPSVIVLTLNPTQQANYVV